MCSAAGGTVWVYTNRAMNTYGVERVGQLYTCRNFPSHIIRLHVGLMWGVLCACSQEPGTATSTVHTGHSCSAAHSISCVCVQCVAPHSVPVPQTRACWLPRPTPDT